MTHPLTSAPTPSLGSQGSPARLPSLIVKSSLATLLLVGALAAAGYALTLPPAPQHDDISFKQAQARLEAFQSLDPLHLSTVDDADVDRALQSMQLSPVATQALRADLTAPTPAPATIPATQDATASPAPAPQVIPAPAQAQSKRLRLVWITLWDTDAEDGDVVRIDTQGYSRTIRLTKKGDTMAVPMPANGIIRVTGIKDGDGGGITVGLASGDARAVFPIMSEGQVLGLKVEAY